MYSIRYKYVAFNVVLWVFHQVLTPLITLWTTPRNSWARKICKLGPEAEFVFWNDKEIKPPSRRLVKGAISTLRDMSPFFRKRRGGGWGVDWCIFIFLYIISRGPVLVTLHKVMCPLPPPPSLWVACRWSLLFSVVERKMNCTRKRDRPLRNSCSSTVHDPLPIYTSHPSPITNDRSFLQ